MIDLIKQGAKVRHFSSESNQDDLTGTADNQKCHSNGFNESIDDRVIRVLGHRVPVTRMHFPNPYSWLGPPLNSAFINKDSLTGKVSTYIVIHSTKCS